MVVDLASLWLPILLSGIAVFIVSSLIWTVFQWHNSDWQKLPDEEALRRALAGAAPGQYSVPYAQNNKARQSSEWQEKYREGPAAMMVVLRHGSMAMGKQLGQWIIYCLVISLLVAYVASATLPAGTEYLRVFRVTGTVAMLAYAGGAAMGSIWFGHTWGRTAKDIADGVIYGLLTAGIFGWLWP
jgi:hypothetical protein